MSKEKFTFMDGVVIVVLFGIRTFMFIVFAIFYPKLVANVFKEFILYGIKKAKEKINENSSV